MVRSPIAGVGYFFRGLTLLVKPGVRFYAIIPLLINCIVFALGIWYAFGQFQVFLGWANGFLPDWLNWLGWVLIPLLVVTMGVGIFFTFSMMANIIAAPFNSILAERVEQHLRGGRIDPAQGNPKGMLLRLIPLIWNEFGKIAYNILWAIPFLVLFIVPVVNVAAPFLWIAFSAWMLAIQYADIPMGNHNLTGGEVRRKLREKRGVSLIFGGTTLLMNTIPFINFLVMPAAVAGATIFWVESLAENNRQ
ncbi:MAG: sulfate transporter CysZ [Magnetococcales bacterium]|nr:sulfate transporter CysZ [Magnetococcales bacterium]